MKTKTKILLLFGLLTILTLVMVITVSAVGGAAFTTFNDHVDGGGKDVCKNSKINCNIYGAKEYVWLNGGPDANHLKPDGYYFFAVLEPGGQPNPNDQGGVPDKNLSDDFDFYTNRVFLTEGGEVSEYLGTHWLDSGRNEPGPGDPKPNGEPPFIRLFPYSDTTNPGGVYIMAICYLGDSESDVNTWDYPVEPRDCKYDAFKVREGKMDYSFYLNGFKVEDLYADGYDSGDPGLEGWKIIIEGTGPDGLPIYVEVYTDENGFWEWYSPVYTFQGKDKPQDVSLTVCEELLTGWTQSFPGGDGCHSVDFTPTGFDSVMDLNFANWWPVDVTACKYRDIDGDTNTTDDQAPIVGWEVSLTEEGIVVDTQYTGEDGCYTWTGLTPGISYDVHEEDRDGWLALDGLAFVWPWEDAYSRASLSHTFFNQPLEGCTPGFWQGGNGFETAGGKWYWNTMLDPDWTGMYVQPFYWGTEFCSVFGCSETGDMWYYINPDQWTTNDDFHKAARSITAAYLNASWGIGYAYTTGELQTMWADAYNGGTLLDLHNELDAANNAYYREEPPAHCPISASIPQ